MSDIPPIITEPLHRETWTPTAVNDIEAYRQAVARIAELEALVIEAASAYNLSGTTDTIYEAEAALVRMCHEGAAALRETFGIIPSPERDMFESMEEFDA